MFRWQLLRFCLCQDKEEVEGEEGEGEGEEGEGSLLCNLSLLDSNQHLIHLCHPSLHNSNWYLIYLCNSSILLLSNLAL